MDLSVLGAIIGFAGAGWAFGNYHGDPDPKGRDAAVTFGPAFVLAATGFLVYIAGDRSEELSPSIVWALGLLGTGIGFVAGRLLGPALRGRR